MGTSNIEHPTSNIQWSAMAAAWMLDVRKCAFLFLIALQLFGMDVIAAEKLQVDLIPVGLRPRNQAPIPVEARFRWDSTRILEGRLEMEFHEGNRVLGCYRSCDLALTGGEQRYRMLLPPLLAPFSDPQVEVQMRFLAGGNALEIEPSVLSLPTVSERSLVVGWCDSGALSGQPTSDLVRNLMLERFGPPTDSVSQRVLTTSIARLTPEDLPVQPLGFTTFDVVVLTAEGFEEASERQLQALARWVKGGGSVCVLVAGGLKPYDIEFLNQLAEATPDGATFLADSAGNLLPPLNKIICLHSGVGRSVLVPAMNGVGVDSDWRRVTAFLWKLRNDQARAMVESGHWIPPVDPQSEVYPAQTRQFRMTTPTYPMGAMAYAIQPTDLGGELLNRLMPKTVRLIPFPALIGVLALFLGMIGPVDYYLLGVLRRRKYTWILFPATSIAFTIAMVLMANHYLGLRDQRRSLIVVDLDKDGTSLRWNRYELVFAARDKQSVTELKDALWAPLEAQMPEGFYNPNGLNYPNNPGLRYQSFGYRGGIARDAGPSWYDGVLPVHFQAIESLRQWQPVLNRIFSFEPPPVPLLPNWPEVEKASPDLSRVRAILSGKKAFNGDLYLVSSSKAMPVEFSPYGILPVEILDKLCHGEEPGWWSLVSQVSPSGGGNFEDVRGIDTEANDSVLAVVTQVGDDIVVYRRFFYGK